MYKQGACPRAEALLREAAEKLPTNAEVLYHLGTAQAKIGRPPGRGRGQGDTRLVAGGPLIG